MREPPSKHILSLLMSNYLPRRAELPALLPDERLVLAPDENEPTERLLLLLDENELLERLLLDDELELLLDEVELLRDERLLLTLLLLDESLLLDAPPLMTTLFLLVEVELLLWALALEELLLLFLTADEPREVELLTLLPPPTATEPRDELLLLPFTMVAPPPRIVVLDTLLGLLGLCEPPFATISFLVLAALCSSKR